MVELKADGPERPPVERAAALIRQLEMTEQCILASSDLNTLERCRAFAPELQTVYIVTSLDPELCGLDVLDGLSVQFAALTPEAVGWARARESRSTLGR